MIVTRILKQIQESQAVIKSVEKGNIHLSIRFSTRNAMVSDYSISNRYTV